MADRSFFKNIFTDLGNAGIVKSIIAMARQLSLKVLADEGVETGAQRDSLRDNGCDVFMSFL